MIGHLIPLSGSNWLHFLELLDIVDMACAPVIGKNTAASLQVLVESSLQTFTELYPAASVIPKQHYLLHMARYNNPCWLLCINHYVTCFCGL